MSVDPANFGLQGFSFPVASGGSCDYPAAGDVRLGITYDTGGHVGTLVLPAVGDVRDGIGYGTLGTEFLGTLGVGEPVFTTATTSRSPADVLRWLLIELGHGTDPTPWQTGTRGNSWPIFAGGEPSRPDDVVTIYDTAGTYDGRSMIDGELLGHFGVQVRIRSVDHPTGWVRANLLRTAMAMGVYQNYVTIGGTRYFVHDVSRISDVLPLGKDNPNTKRSLFTINARIIVSQVPA